MVHQDKIKSIKGGTEFEVRGKNKVLCVSVSLWSQSVDEFIMHTYSFRGCHGYNCKLLFKRST